MSSFTDTGYASISFMVLNSALIFLMTPGLGLFYAGLSQSKNALSNIMVCMVAYSIVTIQWTLFGFSLAFSETGSPFIGNFDLAGQAGVGSNSISSVASSVPNVAFSLYQLQFATISVAIIFGSVSERFRLLPAMIFIFLWTTFVYDFSAYWTWGNRGWLRSLSCLDTLGLDSTPCGVGSYDYAGGGPVHVASGFAGLAYCIILGKRKRQNSDSKPHNLTYVFLGTAMLWFGWFGFNGGSAIAASPRAAMAAFVTVIAASCSSFTWLLIEYFYTKKWSAEAYCSGVVAGLVAITPASGFVAPWAAIVIGFFSGLGVSYAVHIKHWLGADDALDAFGAHGIGGVIGNILAGVFAQKWVAELDGVSIDGGWIEGNWMQMVYQIAGTAAIAAWSFTISYAILYMINLVPGLELRSSDYDEELGADLGEMGQKAYDISRGLSMDEKRKIIRLDSDECKTEAYVDIEV